MPSPKSKKVRGRLSKDARKEAEANEEKKAADAKKKATKKVVSLLLELEWDSPCYQQEEDLPVLSLFGGETKETKVRMSGVYHPVKDAVRKITEAKNMNTDEGCKAKEAWYEEAVEGREKKKGKKKVDAKPEVVGARVYNKPGYKYNAFGGQYSPFLPLATLGAAMAIGDRSVVSLAAMTVAGIATALQINNQPQAGKKDDDPSTEGGLRKSSEEVRFDKAKMFLVDKLDKVGKLDVRGDDDAPGATPAPKLVRLNPKDKDDAIEIEAIRKNIAILRAVAPKGMEAFAEMCVAQEDEDEDGFIPPNYLAKALSRMETKHTKQWAALRTIRASVEALQTTAENRKYQPWVGQDEETKGGSKTVLSWHVYQDTADVDKYYQWTDVLPKWETKKAVEDAQPEPEP